MKGKERGGKIIPSDKVEESLSSPALHERLCPHHSWRGAHGEAASIPAGDVDSSLILLSGQEADLTGSSQEHEGHI